MKKIYLLLIIIFYVNITLLAQDIEVKKFELLEKDQTAVTSPRKDINGVTCGLVKVALKEPGAEFEGSVMGDVQFTGSEYLVYMPNGSKRLGIKHPDYLPTTIVFADYGTKKVASATTYELKVKTNKKKAKVDNSKKGMAVFNIKPSNALLLIDGQVADGSGGAYSLSLPYGTHYYTVKLKDFSINNQVVHIDKNAKTINVDLTEFFAKLDITCRTGDAEISVNGEQKGIGKWGGMVIPGSYVIEASKDGCHSQTRQIVLTDNDTQAIDFSALKTITGSLCVDYEPAGSDVLLNGKKVGVTPLVLNELPVGEYQLEIWKEYYVKEFFNVKIAEDQEWKESGKLKLTQFGELIVNAKKEEKEGFSSGGMFTYYLASYYRYGAVFSESEGPGDFCEMDTLSVPFDPVKAVSLYKKLANSNPKAERLSIWKDWAEGALGPCYPSTTNDEDLSLCWAKKEVEDEVHNGYTLHWFERCSYAALAWHYYYGVGCTKDIAYAKRLIRNVCNERGEYKYPAFQQLIKDMGLSHELKYNPALEPTAEELGYEE